MGLKAIGALVLIASIVTMAVNPIGNWEVLVGAFLVMCIGLGMIFAGFFWKTSGGIVDWIEKHR